jgi:hypothetical protein
MSAAPKRLESLAAHLKIHLIKPPDYDRLELVGKSAPVEGSVLCCKLDTSDLARLDHLYEAVPDLRVICRQCPLVMLAPIDVLSLLQTFHTRPLQHGFRAVLPLGIDWKNVLRNALTDERTLARDVAEWLLFPRRHRRADRYLLEAIVSLGRGPLDDTLHQVGASPNTIASRLSRLSLPSVSKLRTLGTALRAAVRLQRTPEKSAEVVAGELGYSSIAGLTLLLRRTLAARVQEIRERLGWEWLLARWEARIGRA